MGEWPFLPLGDLAVIQQGRYLAKEDMSDAASRDFPIPVHGANGVIGWTSVSMYPHGAPLVTCRGSNSGMVLWADGPLWVSNNAMAVLPRNGDARFLYYLLRSQPPYDVVTGSAQPQITRRDLERRLYTWPDLGLQSAISRLLGSLDDKIELSRQTNETLEAMTRAIFRDWFVDFGPTRAKMEGREPYLPSEIWAQIPAEMSDSLPGAWRTGALGEIAELNPESWSNREHPDQVRYVDLSNAKWGEIENVQVLAWQEAPSRARRVLRAGDTIFGTVRPANGSFALVGTDDLTGSTGFAVLRPREAFDREFVWCAATATGNVERLANLADGAAYPAVRAELVASTPVALAPPSHRRAFSGLVAPLIDRVILNRAENETLRDIRDLLLPKLLSGELTLNSLDAAD